MAENKSFHCRIAAENASKIKRRMYDVLTNNKFVANLLRPETSDSQLQCYRLSTLSQ
jgi:ethanolamine utilization cobalamin adenosyltransferase